MQQVLLLHLWFWCIFKCHGHPSLICFKDPPELGIFFHYTSASAFRHLGVLQVELKSLGLFGHTPFYTLIWHLFPADSSHDLAEILKQPFGKHRAIWAPRCLAEHNQQLHRAETGTQPPLPGSRNQNTEVFQSTSPLKYLLQYTEESLHGSVPASHSQTISCCCKIIQGIVK